MTRYQELLSADLSSEQFVRQALQLFEGEFRQLALVALSEWERLDIVAPELFQAVASLQRPSWGMWNGLLTALRDARRNVLRSAPAPIREKVELAAAVRRVLDGLDDRLAGDSDALLKPLCELTRTSMPRRPKASFLLTLPINLRNRIAHDMPADARWWNDAADAIRPLVRYHADDNPCERMQAGAEYAAPWFLQDAGEGEYERGGEEETGRPGDKETRSGGEREGQSPSLPLPHTPARHSLWAFNGVERDFSIIYVSRDGDQKFSTAHSQELLNAFQRLLGKTDSQETDFRRLLSKLAPEEVKGVLMGDYLVGRPVGAGGFATVHVGRQLSTGRKVAIKILHDGMSEDVRLRFQQEARYLSQLNHGHIVSVYGFGEEPWSAPRAFSLSEEPWFEQFSKTAPVKLFIAMEWIEGRTFDDIFREGDRDQDHLSRVTEWFSQATGALVAVHATGLIHRDIKPGNLMVTDENDVKLMDFGIARTQEENATVMTMAGQSFGTPAYMSPEQIRAVDAETEVGPATDIYSLCATFYELYTGRRLYDHDAVPVETVRTRKLTGIRPARPQLMTKRLPWELETILLGGLEPEAADRYRNAESLDRDIRHFLNDESIEYRKPSLWRRARLGYRRNRTTVNLVAGFTLLAIAGTAIYIRDVQEQRNLANEAAVKERLAREAEETQRKLAEEQRRLAEESFRQARSAVDDLFTEVSEDTLLNQPGLQPLRRRLLEKTLEYYREFLEQRANDASLTEELGLTHFRAARIVEDIESPEKALPDYELALAVQQQFTDRHPEDPARLARLGETVNAMGRANHRLHKLDEAAQAYRDAYAIRKRLVVMRPDEDEHYRALANSVMNIGLVEKERGNRDAARKELEEAQQIRQERLVRNANDAKFQRDFGMGAYNLATFHMGQRDIESAAGHFEQAIAAFEKSLELDAGSLDNRFRLATCCRLLGDLKTVSRQTEESLRLYGRARDEMQRLAARNPDVPDYASGLAGILMNLGRLQGKAQGLDAFVQATDLLQKLADDFPDVPAYRRDLAVGLRVLALIQIDRQEKLPALGNLDRSLHYLTQLVGEFPGNQDYLLQKTQTEAAIRKAGGDGLR